MGPNAFDVETVDASPWNIRYTMQFRLPKQSLHLKMWLRPQFYESIAQHEQQRQSTMPALLKAYDYEVRVYRDVILPLLNPENPISCPNFIQFIAAGNDCSITNVAAFLHERPVIPGHEAAQAAAWRLANANLGYDPDNRNSTTSTVSTDLLLRTRPVWNITTHPNDTTTNDGMLPPAKRIALTEFSNARFNMLVTTVPMNAVKLNRIIDDQKVELGSLLVQVMFACLAMSNAGIVHNDLHLNNILVDDIGYERAPGRRCAYTIGQDNWFIHERIQHRIYVYDFDRAFGELLGNNPALGPDIEDPKRENRSTLCRREGTCNYLSPNQDAISFLVMYARKLRNEELITALKNDVCRTKKAQYLFDQAIRIPTRFVTLKKAATAFVPWLGGDTNAFQPYDYQQFYDMKTIALNIAKRFATPAASPKEMRDILRPMIDRDIVPNAANIYALSS